MCAQDVISSTPEEKRFIHFPSQKRCIETDDQSSITGLISKPITNQFFQYNEEIQYGSRTNRGHDGNYLKKKIIVSKSVPPFYFCSLTFILLYVYFIGKTENGHIQELRYSRRLMNLNRNKFRPLLFCLNQVLRVSKPQSPPFSSSTHSGP